MSRKSAQGCLKLQACVDVIGVIIVRGMDDVLVGYTELCSHVLEGGWVELLQELYSVLNRGFASEPDCHSNGV